MSSGLDVSAPDCFAQSLHVQDLTLMAPGPAQCTQRVLDAMAKPTMTPLNPHVFKIMDDIKEGLKYVFQTRNELTLCVSGTGHAAIESVLDNILEPGAKVLVPLNGFWCRQIMQLATRRGLNVIPLEGKPSESFSLETLESAIKQHRPDLLFIVHGESSVGVLQPLEGLGDICHKYDCLLAVDGVVTSAGAPIYMDRWAIDVLVSGSQKAFGAPPGLGPVSFSPKAQEKIFSRKTPVPVYYWDMKVLGRHWNCIKNETVTYHHTIPVNLLYAFRESLAEICAETLEKRWERQSACAKLFQHGLQQTGWEMFVPKQADRLPTVTTVCVPEDIDKQALVTRLREVHNFDVHFGIYPNAYHVLRVGILGNNAHAEVVNKLIEALNESAKYLRNHK